MKDDQNIWNFFFSMVFVGVVIFCMGILSRYDRLPQEIELFDLALVTLATFRLTRLFVYDKITRWLRDLFMQKKEIEGSPGEVIVVRGKYQSGPLRTISDLLSCPWCFGVWAAFAVSFFYFLSPIAWYPIMILAVAGVATFVQLLANMVGWRAELSKLEAKELE